MKPEAQAKKAGHSFACASGFKSHRSQHKRMANVNGEVLAIRYRKHEAAEVVFKQGVKDPAAIKPFREVVKRIAH